MQHGLQPRISAIKVKVDCPDFVDTAAAACWMILLDVHSSQKKRNFSEVAFLFGRSVGQ